MIEILDNTLHYVITLIYYLNKENIGLRKKSLDFCSQLRKLNRSFHE